MKKILYYLLSIVLILTSLYSAIQIFNILQENNEERKQNDYLIEIAKKEDKSEPKEEKNENQVEIDFEALKKVNDEIIAWIKIPDTTIDYAIVQGTDNDFYLHYNARKEENYAGAVFVDCQNANPFKDEHTIVYAHNVKHGTMFAPLEKYMDEDFFKKHPVYYIYTPEANYEVEIFAFYTTTDVSDAYELIDIGQYILKWQSDSLYSNDVKVNDNDRVVTLSTCSYERNDQPSELRHVLKGVIKKVDEQGGNKH